jgi:uncharacterized phage protein gp47/JayE
MALQTYTFSRLVTNIATAMQAASNTALDFTVGSILRAIVEATAGVILWLQAIILQLLTLTRASTSRESDLDTWMADFSLVRLPAIAASGQVTFARFTNTQQALIPVGAGLQTADGTKFTVQADTGNGAFDAGQGGYVVNSGISSLGVPVQAAVAGAAGNVQSGTIILLTTPIPYIDTVTNASGFVNGIDAETDAAFRARFVLYLASLSKATKTAVGYAVTSLQQGLSYTITENEDYDGTTDMGAFYVVVDDGSGTPPGGLLTNAANAIEAVRPLGSRYSVHAPITLTVDVGMTITSAPGYDHSTVVAAVGAALDDFIDGLPLATSLPYTQLASIAYSVPGVVNATSILLNSGTTDLPANQKQKVVSGTMTIA